MRRETQGRRMRKVKTYNKKGLGTKTRLCTIKSSFSIFLHPLAKSWPNVSWKFIAKNLFLCTKFFFKRNIELGGREGVAKREIETEITDGKRKNGARKRRGFATVNSSHKNGPGFREGHKKLTANEQKRRNGMIGGRRFWLKIQRPRSEDL